MSAAELLPAIRALPKSEQVQLLHLLIDGITETKPPEDGIPEELRKLLPPGFVAEVWFPEANPDAAAAQQALQESRATGE